MGITRGQFQKFLKFVREEKIEISDITGKPIPVINESLEVEFVDIDDIFYIEQHKNNVFEILTSNGTYSFNKRVMDIMNIVQQNGNFQYLEKNLLVNFNQIKKYDSYMEVVYFTDYHKSQNAPQARVKAATMKSIIKRLGKDKDVTETQPEVKILSCCQVSKLTT